MDTDAISMYRCIGTYFTRAALLNQKPASVKSPLSGWLLIQVLVLCMTSQQTAVTSCPGLHSENTHFHLLSPPLPIPSSPASRLPSLPHPPPISKMSHTLRWLLVFIAKGERRRNSSSESLGIRANVSYVISAVRTSCGPSVWGLRSGRPN